MEDLNLDEIEKYINLGRTEINDNRDKIDSLLKDLQEGKIDSLNEAVNDIQELILQRKELSSNFSSRVKKINIDISNFINEAKQRSNVLMNDASSLRQFMTDIVALKSKGVEIDALDLKEQIDCWRDIAELKRELRERIQEIQEKKTRADLLDEILREK